MNFFKQKQSGTEADVDANFETQAYPFSIPTFPCCSSPLQNISGTTRHFCFQVSTDSLVPILPTIKVHYLQKNADLDFKALDLCGDDVGGKFPGDGRQFSIEGGFNTAVQLYH